MTACFDLQVSVP